MRLPRPRPTRQNPTPTPAPTELDRHGNVDRVIFYTDNAGQWRWRYRAGGNSAILADSAQGYTNLTDAWTAAERVTDRMVEQDINLPDVQLQAVILR